MSSKKRKPSEGIWEINQKITKLEINSIIGNPAFPGINQRILFYLDHESQIVFRQVCQSWKEQVDVPLFWIKKLNRKSHPKQLDNTWQDLVGRIQKGSDLEKEVTECLMKWYGRLQSWSDEALKGMTPTHVAALLGYTNIFMFVASYTENVNTSSPYGWTPLHIAAEFGSTEIFKFLASQVENPNAPAPNGLTPLQLATNNNHPEIVEFLSQILAN